MWLGGREKLYSVQGILLVRGFWVLGCGGCCSDRGSVVSLSLSVSSSSPLSSGLSSTQPQALGPPRLLGTLGIGIACECRNRTHVG